MKDSTWFLLEVTDIDAETEYSICESVAELSAHIENVAGKSCTILIRAVSPRTLAHDWINQDRAVTP